MINLNVTDPMGRKHEIEAREGDTLMETLREFEWGVAAMCGGLCSCGTCHVYLEGEWPQQFSQADAEEQDLLDVFEHSRDNSRLSCQLKLLPRHDGLALAIAPDE